jgi:hypothetical protein
MNLFSLLQAPINTDQYYIAGYAVFFVTMAIYLTVLVARQRNLKAEYELLVELEKEE